MIYMDDTMIIACRSGIFMEQGALDAASVRRVWAGAGLQRAAYRGGGILRGIPIAYLYQRLAGRYKNVCRQVYKSFFSLSAADMTDRFVGA